MQARRLPSFERAEGQSERGQQCRWPSKCHRARAPPGAVLAGVLAFAPVKSWREPDEGNVEGGTGAEDCLLTECSSAHAELPGLRSRGCRPSVARVPSRPAGGGPTSVLVGGWSPGPPVSLGAARPLRWGSPGVGLGDSPRSSFPGVERGRKLTPMRAPAQGSARVAVAPGAP